MGYNAVSTAVSNISVVVDDLKKKLEMGEYYNRQIKQLNEEVKFLKQQRIQEADYDKIYRLSISDDFKRAITNLNIHGKNLDSSFQEVEIPNLKLSFTEKTFPKVLVNGEYVLLVGAAVGAVLLSGGLVAAEAMGTAASTASTLTTAAGSGFVLGDSVGTIAYGKEWREVANYAGKITKDKLDRFYSKLDMSLAVLSIKIQGDEKILENYVSKMKSVYNMLEDVRKRINDNIIAKTTTIDMQDYISKLYKINKSLSELDNLKIVDLQI